MQRIWHFSRYWSTWTPSWPEDTEPAPISHCPAPQCLQTWPALSVWGEEKLHINITWHCLLHWMVAKCEGHLRLCNLLVHFYKVEKTDWKKNWTAKTLNPTFPIMQLSSIFHYNLHASLYVHVFHTPQPKFETQAFCYKFVLSKPELRWLGWHHQTSITRHFTNLRQL